MSSLPERVRSHGRTASGDERRRVAVPRRSTRGPLDVDTVIDDPLAATSSTPPPPSRAFSPPPNTVPQQPTNPRPATFPQKDFSFLQDPQAYHLLPTSSIPQPFLSAPHAPPLSSPLDTLLHSGHYRLAAVAAARNLVSAASPTDYATLLRLLHIRLACLCLINEHALAAQESKVLGDLNSAFYRDLETNAHLVPWELRLLVVRLAALGYGEWRKGVMGYYELARECRENAVRAATPREKELWKGRLRDCGVRVANVLVEMGDFEGAGRHLATLSAPSLAVTPGKPDLDAHAILMMETLVWLRVGAIASARACLARANTTSTTASQSSDPLSPIPNADSDILTATLNALAQLPTSLPTTLSHFTALHAAHPTNAMVTQNLALMYLYSGQIAKAHELLSGLVEGTATANADASGDREGQGVVFHSAVFNLCTVWELCCEGGRARKEGLARRLAGRRDGGGVGWEVAGVSLKM